jgi:hypothetical protein
LPRYIIKLKDTDRDYYLMWSTIVDAPITYGLTLEQFQDWYREEYGKAGLAEFTERMTRVVQKGTSSNLHSSVEEVIKYNRAGPDETCLTREQILEKYCRSQRNTDG